MRNIKYIKVLDGYVCQKDYTYYSPRYKKEVTVHKGAYSDGATYAIDVDTDGFWVHDCFCRYGEWDDHTPITNWQASSVLSDILKRDGFWFRAYTWRYMTFIFGGKGIKKRV